MLELSWLLSEIKYISIGITLFPVLRINFRNAVVIIRLITPVNDYFVIIPKYRYMVFA